MTGVGRHRDVAGTALPAGITFEMMSPVVQLAGWSAEDLWAVLTLLAIARFLGSIFL